MPQFPIQESTFAQNRLLDFVSLFSTNSSCSQFFPLILKESKISGTIIQARLGKINLIIIFPVVICPPIHNIVVVTSPIGVQAPPALAAITTIPIKNILVCLSLINFLNKETITMVVVRLSRTAERKNVTMLIIQSNLRLSFVVILLVMTSKPSWASISSTIVIAPNRKNKIPDICPKCSYSCSDNQLCIWSSPLYK